MGDNAEQYKETFETDQIKKKMYHIIKNNSLYKFQTQDQNTKQMAQKQTT
jgi:hypothetical protein